MRRALVLGVLLAGCDLDVPTLDFSSDATTVSVVGGDGASTAVSICPGPSGLLSCDQSHRFTVTLGTESLPAEPELFGGESVGFATNQADERIVITRDDGASGNGTLPAPFALTSPEANSTLSRGSHVHLAWDADGADPMTWTSDVSCAKTGAASAPVAIDDTGALSIATSALPSGAGTCSVTITLVRTRAGTMNHLFGDGSTLVAQQSRTVSFQLGE